MCACNRKNDCILSPGIFLPNGDFVSNMGDGHAKNAQRICGKYPSLTTLMHKSKETFDDFVLQCGFSIVASYDNVWHFKIAKDNPFQEMKDLRQLYEQNGKSIWDYWNIIPEYIQEVEKITELMIPQITYKPENHIIFIGNLCGKLGFVIGNHWYPNEGDGHEKNARKIIFSNSWQQEWYLGNSSAQDFIVLEKGAIQLGSGVNNRIIVASSRHHTKFKIDNFLREYFKCYRYEYNVVLY